MPKSPTNTSGQVLLIVLLTMAVGLVIVLSVVSRTVSDIGETAREDDSSRAFSAAEAGVERALITGAGGLESLGNRSSFDVSIAGLAAGAKEYHYPGKVANSDSATIWFVSHTPDGDLTCSGGNVCYTPTNLQTSFNVCWGESGSQPAVEISILYDSASPAGVNNGDWSGVRVFRTAFDIVPQRTVENHFGIADDSGCTQTNPQYPIHTIVNLAAPNTNCAGRGAGCLLLAKVRMLYNGTVPQPLGAYVSDGALPSQGVKVTSTGTSGEATRKVEVYQTFGELPPIFDAVLFSSTGIVKATTN